MNSKAFRRSQPKSASSSTFISLHFNKSDEEQLEISYKKGADVSQSNFYVAKGTADIKPVSDLVLKADSVDDVSVEDVPNFQSSLETKSAECKSGDVVDFPSNSDLSPAIEAAEVADSESFYHDINSKLEKAKYEILETDSSFPETRKSPFLSSDLPKDLESDDRTHQVPPDQDNRNPITNVTSSLRFVFRLMSYARNSLKFHLLVAVLAFACAPIPSWLSGFLVGTLLSSSLVYWLYKPQKSRRNLYCVSPSVAYASHFQEETGILKGWMNELPSSFGSYSPEHYHVSCTLSVYVRLEGSYLRLSFPPKNIPRRAMFNEPRHEMQFVHQQHYDVTGATVHLLPQGLSKKRLWSKKYPICLRIPNLKGAVLSPANGTVAKKDKFVARVDENNEIVIYLFARTDRDKSLWFSRFVRASKAQRAERSHSPTLSISGRTTVTEQQSSFFDESKRTLSVDFAQLQSSLSDEGEDEDALDNCDESSFVKLNLSKQQRFEMYMAALLAPLHPALSTTNKGIGKDTSSSLTWLNVLIGRLFFDFLVEDVWAQRVTEKIQKKLNRIKLPFFLSELSVRDIHLGSSLPRLHRATDPCLDERGLWVDLDVSYTGSFHMTLETKLDLQRFNTRSPEDTSSETPLLTPQDHPETTSKPPVLCDSDEDSLESSSEEECPSPSQDTVRDGTTTGSSRSRRLMRLVDKLAQSSYFQHAAKNRYVKRAMDDLSNTPLVLTVEVQWLTGTLAVNIPPWPTDRLWYGFRGNPSLSLTARPKLGQHVVTFTHVTEWIEKKLTSEFQKVLVLPNMDDLIIPIMHPAPLDASS